MSPVFKRVSGRSPEPASLILKSIGFVYDVIMLADCMESSKKFNDFRHLDLTFQKILLYYW